MTTDLDDYDWEQVFNFANGVEGSPQPVPPGAAVDAAPFGRDDVAEVVWIEAGENEGPDWLVGGRLRDGRWFFVAAGCDYTGWDCRSGGNAYVAATAEEVVRFGMGDHERGRLGLSVSDGERRIEKAGW